MFAFARETAGAAPDGSALLGLIPQAQALKPALKANERLFEQTLAPIRDQIRPFTRETRSVLTHAKEGAAPLSKSVRSFGNSLGAFNSFLNELAYKPKGRKQSFLFYLPWLNHNTNATFNLSDPAGPIGRAMVMISCNGAALAAGAAAGLPYIQTVLRGANVPRRSELPTIAAGAQGVSGCGPGTE